MYDKEKWTRTSIRGASYANSLGGYVARKTTRSGATDYVLINRNTSQPKVFKTAEEAINAKPDKNYRWYH